MNSMTRDSSISSGEVGHSARLRIDYIGQNQTPVVVVDQFYPNVDRLVAFGARLEQYASDPDDNYPGAHADSPAGYSAFLCHAFQGRIAETYGLTDTLTATSRFSRVTTQECDLSLLQSLPHVDAFDGHKIAVVHYLCSEMHGGTGFYRNEETGFENITLDHAAQYQRSIKRAAIQGRINGGAYLRGSGQGFEKIHEVQATWNRAVFYPSNLLHAGQINPATDVAGADDIGRLTLTSQICIAPSHSNANPKR